MSDNFARLQLAISRGLARIEWHPDPEDVDGVLDIDLGKGIDAEGYTVDGGISASLVRGIRDGSLQYHYVVIETRRPSCEHCGRGEDWQVAGSLGGIAIGSHADCEQYERDLADDDEVIAGLNKALGVSHE